MGKGDKKTRKGKIFMGSYGVKRKRANSNGSYKPSLAKNNVQSVNNDEAETKKVSEKKEVAAPKTKVKNASVSEKIKSEKKSAPAKKPVTKKVKE